MQKNPFGAPVPAMPQVLRRAAPARLFEAVVIGWFAAIATAVTASLTLYLLCSRLVEIEAGLAAAARV